MKYVIMCGGEYKFQKWFVKVGSETLVERTIRLLKNNGVTDIAVSTNNPAFENIGVPILHHDNDYIHGGMGWINAFYLMTESVCYLFGDVLFSPEAIKTIVETPVDSIEFFASSPPFSPQYIKPWAEPFAFKVQDTDLFAECVAKFKDFEAEHLFNRKPAISWELWQVITDSQLNWIDYNSYHAINDYTCDIDCPEDIDKFKAKGVF